MVVVDDDVVVVVIVVDNDVVVVIVVGCCCCSFVPHDTTHANTVFRSIAQDNDLKFFLLGFLYTLLAKCVLSLFFARVNIKTRNVHASASFVKNKLKPFYRSAIRLILQL